MSIQKKQHSNDGETQVSLPIEGMTCASCVGRVEAALAKVEGVQACTEGKVLLCTEEIACCCKTFHDAQGLYSVSFEDEGYLSGT